MGTSDLPDMYTQARGPLGPRARGTYQGKSRGHMIQLLNKLTEFNQMTNPADYLLSSKNQLMETFSIDKIHNDNDMLFGQRVAK